MKDPQTLTPEQAQLRDLTEAARILTRESRLLPERRHLEAIGMDAAVAKERVKQMGQIIAAMLLDRQEEGEQIPASLFAHVREKNIGIVIDPKDDGSVVVKKVMPRSVSQPLAATPDKVM